MRNALRALWAEPRAAGAPARVWRDWALVAVLVPTAVAEWILRDSVEWGPFVLVLAGALAVPLLWRRTHPLTVVAVVFGTLALLDAVAVVAADGSTGLYTNAYVLILPYALFRWGSGREAVLGLPIMLLFLSLVTAADFTGLVDAIVGGFVLLFPAVVGALVRLWSSSRARSREQIKLVEREQLARDLHDSVAHHVSAIVIRAQAGKVVAETDPAAAVEALSVIEDEAKRSLAEMRLIVGVLREGEGADLAPAPGVADIELLTRSLDGSSRVEVDLSGELDGLNPSVDAALYRVAQESVTNAARHATGATVVAVSVVGDADSVRLTVRDDGHGASDPGREPIGYGLAGMKERVTLLGGTLRAGPNGTGGWTVDAVVPRTGSTV
ncbi:MAG: sensor histidine kinase [Solirubrobacterales bacterium]